MAGGNKKYSVLEAGNLGFGQIGSVFVDASTATAVKPPTGTIFVAITFLEDTIFDSSGGLKAEDANQYINTESAAHNESAGNATTSQGELGAKIQVDNTFPQGATIFGRWTEINIGASGMLVAYIG